MDKAKSAFLDCSRWVAAFAVAFGHAAHLLLGHRNFFTELGHSAVIVFFVTSGYLVGGITWEKWKRKGPDLLGYSIARFSRIYIVLVPALLIGYALDIIGLKNFALYSHLNDLNIGSIDAIAPRLGLKTLVGNMLMLEGTAVEILGSNGPLWSLAYEWWYYCLFFFIGGGLLYRGWARYVLWACAVPLLAILDPRLLFWGSFWALGMGAYFVKERFTAWIGGLALFGALLAWQALPKETAVQQYIVDALVAGGFTALLCSNVSAPFPKFQERMAAFSYSVYLFHFPALLFLVAALGWKPLGSEWWQVFAAVGALYAFCYGLSLLTERHTQKVRLYLVKVTASIKALQRATASSASRVS